ncbi:zinc finger, ring fyve phd-type [Trichoderma arundinaceum]|uniref:Zinc finger, ring fyve phd-type n=1 Tax=Trichoderma arundinaceum TaxID=490622 RepID=A0A395NMM8_TRIAR|nr:zinc finger, ring fyve phd-type [Trichoderma arundinaceum]
MASASQHRRRDEDDYIPFGPPSLPSTQAHLDNMASGHWPPPPVAMSDSSDEDLGEHHRTPARRISRRNRFPHDEEGMMNRNPDRYSPDVYSVNSDPPSPPPMLSGHDAGLQSQYAGLHSQYYATRTPHPGPQIKPHLSSLDIPRRYGSNAILDMYALTYVGDPDSNLLCPICHDPLVDPVTTPCDHTFCYRCLRRSMASSPAGGACPIDREPLLWTDCSSSIRLIRTQLNNLMVKCPHHGRGCEEEMKREVVERHATMECSFREFPCPDTDCGKTTRYKPTDDKCHHQEANCMFCDAIIEDADRDIHLLQCPKSKTRCSACWTLIIREQEDGHRNLDCDAIEVACRFQSLGCPVRVVRAHQELHALSCPFHPDSPSGAIIRSQREIIETYSSLGSQLRHLRAKQEETSRRLDYIAGPVHRPVESTFRDSRAMQDLDAGFGEVHQGLTNLERQSMWTVNQIMPVREEVNELRNNLNMIRAQVSWLLSRSRDEGHARPTSSGTTRPTSMGSDTAREPMPPMMRQRRRSSSADVDLPRL